MEYCVARHPLHPSRPSYWHAVTKTAQEYQPQIVIRNEGSVQLFFNIKLLIFDFLFIHTL
jgi:hypothetical protein